jgi:hypothetical protein
MNLLKETLDDIKSSGHNIADIIYIGSEESGFCCEWSDYKTIADIDYNSGFGAQEIASDLVIVFSDGVKMWRSEYDGSEAWSYSKPFKMPVDKKKITTFCNGGMWEDLEDMNTTDKHE